MQSRIEPDGVLILSYDSTAWAKGFLVAAAAFLAYAAYLLATGSRNEERLFGSLAGVGVFLAAGLLMFETALVRVDPRSKTICWRRRSSFWQRGGTLAFGDVRAVVIEASSGTRKVPMKRIGLRLASGERLQLTYGSQPDDGRLARAAASFRKALGQPEQLPAESEARALAEFGRFDEAEDILIEREGLSREEASKRVEVLWKARGPYA